MAPQTPAFLVTFIQGPNQVCGEQVHIFAHFILVTTISYYNYHLFIYLYLPSMIRAVGEQEDKESTGICKCSKISQDM